VTLRWITNVRYTVTMLDERGLALLVATMALAGVGCGSADDDGDSAFAGATGGGGMLVGSGGSSTGGTPEQSGGAGGSLVSEGCPQWPRSQLFPYVGPWFYGPHPGPCSMLIGETTNPNFWLDFSYDEATGHVIGATGLDGDTTYVWENDLLVRETTGATTYEYVYETDVVRINRDGAPLYAYHLDPDGYPVDLEMNVDSDPAFDVRMRHDYENCRIVSRTVVEIAPVAAGSEGSFAKIIEYDDEGNLSLRRDSNGTGRDERFTYDCWQ